MSIMTVNNFLWRIRISLVSIQLIISLYGALTFKLKRYGMLQRYSFSKDCLFSGSRSSYLAGGVQCKATVSIWKASASWILWGFSQETHSKNLQNRPKLMTKFSASHQIHLAALICAVPVTCMCEPFKEPWRLQFRTIAVCLRTYSRCPRRA